MKVYQVVVTAVITSETDPVLGDGQALIQDMVASDTIQVGSKVIGEVVDIDELTAVIRRRPAKVKSGGAHVAPVEAP